MPGPVKIYDRPERPGPSPALLVVILLVVLIAGYFLYRTFYHPPVAQQHANATAIHVQTAIRQEVKRHGEYRFAAGYR